MKYQPEIFLNFVVQKVTYTQKPTPSVRKNVYNMIHYEQVFLKKNRVID